MSNVHVCSLPQKDTTGLPRLAPNASICKRLTRKFRKLIVLNPKNSRCASFFYNRSVIMHEQQKHIQSRYCYIIHPFSTLTAIIEILFFILWTGKMFTETVIDNMVYHEEYVHFIDLLSIAVQLTLVVSIFFVGYVDTNTKEIVIDHKRVIKRYLKTFFIFDLVASEVLHLFSVYSCKTITTTLPDFHWYTHNIVRHVHLPCLYVRLNTVLRYLDEIGRTLKIGKRTRTAFGYILKTYMYLHFFGCMLYLVPQVVYSKDWPSDSWLVVAKIHPSEHAPFFKIYGECLLMSIFFFFGASAGKYTAVQTNEQICLTIVAFFGRLYTLFLIADTLKMFGIVGLSESNYERELSQVKEYMTSNDFSVNLKSKIIRYFEYKFQKHRFDEFEILTNLSEGLRSQIFLFLAKVIMEKCNVFKFVPQQDVARLIAMMKLETYTPGDFIFKPGQHIEDIFFISSGSIAILNKDGVELCHLEDGEMFGLCSLAIGKEQNSALVLESSDIFLINTNMFYQFLEEYPDAIIYIRRLAKERLADYKQLELMVRNKGGSCQEELKNGTLLEKRRKRLE